MSTSNEPPEIRPRPDDVRQTASGLVERLRENATSIRQSITLAGVGGVLLGGIIWIFIRDLSGAALIVVFIGFALLLIAAAMSWRTLRKVVFGRGGKYGLNSVSILILAFGIAGAINYVLFWADGRPNPPGFLRVDTTFTKQFLLEEKVQTTLDALTEPVEITAFFPTDTEQERAEWRETEDVLSEFKRRSSVHPLNYSQVDPELNPSEASRYGVTSYPSLVIEGKLSQRREIIGPSIPATPTSIARFTEQDLVTALLVVNEISQKQVMFITGHSERQTSDREAFDGYGLAWDALDRENYGLFSGTLPELGTLMASGDPTLFPAVVIFAGPTQEMSDAEGQIIREYARLGGSILLMTDPELTPITFLNFLSRYGVTIGIGEVVDTASFIPPTPSFLQIKRSNQQFPPHDITEDFDVIYMPGAALVGVTIDLQTIPVVDNTLYVQHRILATSTLSSWAETSLDGEINFDPNDGDLAGPLPVAITIEAIAELQGQPIVEDGEFVQASIVVIGDTDFASNQVFASAKNGDLLVNSVNWLAKDFELISIRTKTSAFREFLLTTPERDFVRWSGWLLMPSLIGLAGIWVWWRRR